jgi:hypothetical protein
VFVVVMAEGSVVISAADPGAQAAVPAVVVSGQVAPSSGQMSVAGDSVPSTVPSAVGLTNPTGSVHVLDPSAAEKQLSGANPDKLSRSDLGGVVAPVVVPDGGLDGPQPPHRSEDAVNGLGDSRSRSGSVHPSRESSRTSRNSRLPAKEKSTSPSHGKRRHHKHALPYSKGGSDLYAAQHSRALPYSKGGLDYYPAMVPSCGSQSQLSYNRSEFTGRRSRSTSSGTGNSFNSQKYRTPTSPSRSRSPPFVAHTGYVTRRHSSYARHASGFSDRLVAWAIEICQVELP